MVKPLFLAIVLSSMTYFEKPFESDHLISQATLEQFGAKGDGINDDTQAISKALNSKIQVIYAKKTKAYYKVSSLIIVDKIIRKKLVATGVKFLNSDLTKATFLFQNSKNIEIQGGEYGYTTMPTANGGNSQHVFQFDRCQNVLINKVHILNSPEMGIAITNSNYITIQNSRIEHTFRDGTYSHYSANIKYINNIYSNIKDDAMSFHDYGIDSQKKQLLKYGYKQATNLLANGNRVQNAYQGFGSIGANGVQIINNKFQNTVLAGIAIFNSKELYPNGTALVNNAKLINNTINRACSTVIINDKSYSNSGQASTGRAAIFIGSLGANNQLNMGEVKRLKNISLSNNKVSNSGANGFFGKDVDNLKLLSNEFSNCSGAVLSESLAGDVIEVGNVTDFFANNNTILDTRTKIQHRHGYALNNVTGQIGNWTIKGVLSGEKLLTASKAIKIIPKVNKKSNQKP